MTFATSVPLKSAALLPRAATGVPDQTLSGLQPFGYRRNLWNPFYSCAQLSRSARS